MQHFLPSGPFAILPMVNNRCSLVWTERADEARRIMALDEAGALAEIETRMGYQLGKLSLVGKLACYPLTMTLARGMVKPRIALAGDAAHGLHWIAGQGLNHGLKDAAALTEVLVDAARLGLDPGDLTVLQRYERWRRFDSASSAMTAAALNRLFANDIAPLRMVRQLGLGIVDRLPRLKSVFMREAAGLPGNCRSSCAASLPDTFAPCARAVAEPSERDKLAGRAKQSTGMVDHVMENSNWQFRWNGRQVASSFTWWRWSPSLSVRFRVSETDCGNGWPLILALFGVRSFLL